MNWSVNILNKDVEEELEALDDTLKAKFLHIAEMLEVFSPHKIREPYVKSLGNKLWEMRMKGKTGIARAIYVLAPDRRIEVLHVFVKKTTKTPRSAIETALKRKKEVMI
jgi:phage-related protein